MPNVTISKEDDKLVITRKPKLPTWREKNFGCLFLVMLFVLLPVVSLCIGSFFAEDMQKREDCFTGLITYLIVVGIVSSVIALSVIYNRFRNRRKPVRPPDYDHDILSFEVNQFSVQYRGRVYSFSYRFDARPMLRQSSFSEHMGIMIPCNPLDDLVPGAFDGGYYCMEWWLDNAETERIFASIKEYLETIR
jgi:hypothetical protein